MDERRCFVVFMYCSLIISFGISRLSLAARKSSVARLQYRRFRDPGRSIAGIKDLVTSLIHQEQRLRLRAVFIIRANDGRE